MSWISNRSRVRVAMVLAAIGATVLGGCEVREEKGDLVAGKQAFVGKCGSCHILSRAETKGVTGPNLDEAFQRALADGFRRDTVRGVVEKQIGYPALNGVMPSAKELKVSDQQAVDIAAYVASVVAKPGKDTGALADAVGGGQKALAKANGGVLAIPANPSGQLLYIFKNAEAPAGPLSIESKNPSSVPHNIAVEGPGANATGPVIQGGAVSKVQVTVKAGKYEFFCTVQGHREAGMAGTLTVK